MTYPKWCKPRNYRPGVRVKVYNFGNQNNETGTLSKEVELNGNEEICYQVNWDDKEMDKKQHWWIGFLKIIKPNSLKEFIKNGI